MPPSRPNPAPSSARDRARLRAWGLTAGLLVACIAASPGRAQLPPPDTSRAPLVRSLERIEFTGLTRTSEALARRATGLELPAPATPERIESAAEHLRESRLFRSVEVHTRPGAVPGQVVLVFDVREARPVLRFGLGYEDFSGWYLIPAELAADNLTGHGEGLSLSPRIGYRTTGLDLTLRRPALTSARNFWEVRARGEAVDRVYYLDSTETKQRIQRGSTTLRVGRALPGSLALETWLAFESVGVDSNASVYTSRPLAGRNRGDLVPFATLPAAIQRDVRDRRQSRLGLAVKLDRRSGDGLAAHGVWARASAEGVVSDLGNFDAWQADARGYAPLSPGVQLAVRVRGAAVSHLAPFDERYYVGGLYTVRGYPSQSLSPPEGHLNIACASLELRHAWWGPPADPRVAAIAFLDAGTGWSRGTPAVRDASLGAGFGFRARVPWLGRLGIDVAHPMSRSPVHEAFHVYGSLGWAF